MLIGARSESMRHVGMNRADMKEAVLQKLVIGQQYILKSVNATPNDGPVDARCTLIELGKNMAIFKHRNGTRETFTYTEIWKMLMEGNFK